MGNTFLVADTHFGHNNIVNFTRDCGMPLRPWDTIEEHDEALIQYWNETVKPNDTVWHLGDFALTKRHLYRVAPCLNGRKKLILGNHDTCNALDYLEFFDDVCGVRVMGKPKVVLTHIPIAESSVGRWKGNIHGHLHYRTMNNVQYVCVSVEQTDWKPVPLEMIMEKFKDS